MKGNSHPTNDVSLNTSANPSIRDVIDAVGTSRRQFVKGGVGAAALVTAGGLTLSGLVSTVQAAPVAPGLGFSGIGFDSIPASTDIVAGTGSAVADMVRDRQAQPPLRPVRLRLRLPLAHHRPALRPEHQPQRRPPVRLGRRDRPL